MNKLYTVEARAMRIHDDGRDKNPDHATNWRALRNLGYHQGYLRRARQELKREERREWLQRS